MGAACLSFLVEITTGSLSSHPNHHAPESQGCPLALPMDSPDHLLGVLKKPCRGIGPSGSWL